MITSLDIGSSHIKGIVAETRKGGGLGVLAAFKHPSAGIRKGTIVDVEEAGAVLRDLVLDLQKLSKHATQNIFVNLQSEHVRSRISQGMVAVARADQEIQSDDIDRVMDASRAVKLPSNYMVLHNVTREYYVDDIGDISDPLGMSGNRLGVSTLIVEAFAPQFTQLTKLLERVGARVGGVVFGPLASSRAVLTKRLRDLGVLMIDLGFGTTSIAIYEENKPLHTKCIPIGSGHVTNDIAIGLKTSIDAAEKLKTTYGCAVAKDISRKESLRLAEVDPSLPGEVSRRLLAEIIEVRLAEILDLVDNELKSLGRSVQLPGGVILTGGGVKLPGMVELVRSEMKLPVQIGFPNLGGLEVTNPTHEELLDDPEFATAVGLILSAEEHDRKAPRTAGGIRTFFKNFIP